MELKPFWTAGGRRTIQTSNRTLWNWNWCTRDTGGRVWFPLIVPYGIETKHGTTFSSVTVSSNRTLWNWNIRVRLLALRTKKSSNRTLWNWNIRELTFIYCFGESSNRTLWNWNSAGAVLLPTWLLPLIVPYGIETSLSAKGGKALWYL